MLFCEHLKTINPEILKDAIDKYIFPDDPNQRPEKHPCTRCNRRYGFNFFCLLCKKRVCENHLLKHCNKDESHRNSNFVLHYYTGDLYCLRCTKEIFPESYCKYRALKYQKFYNNNDYEDPTIKFAFDKFKKSRANNGLVGLASLGNTCYMNCLLQFFLHNRIIIQWLIFHKCNYTADIPGCLLCELQKLLKKFYDPLRASIPAPSDIFTVMLNKRPDFLATAHLQHDVQEVFSWLIQDISAQGDRHSQNFSKLFYGNIQSFLKCQNCNRKQVYYESCFNFFLPYPDENLSILDCLAEFLENISCSVFCQNCGGKCSKISPSKFISLPQIFVFAISPFNTSRRRVVKTSTKVQLEKEIDISEFIASPDNCTIPSTSTILQEEEEITTSLKSLKRRRRNDDDDDEYISSSAAGVATTEEKPIKKRIFIFSDNLIDARRATTSTPDSDGGDSGLGNENCSPPLESEPSPTTAIHHPHHQHQSSNNKQKFVTKIKNTKYKLDGIIYHRGDASGGHYYAKVKNHMSSGTVDDEWIECNDTKVSITSLDSECGDQPYLFFYCLNNNRGNNEFV